MRKALESIEREGMQQKVNVSTRAMTQAQTRAMVLTAADRASGHSKRRVQHDSATTDQGRHV